MPTFVGILKFMKKFMLIDYELNLNKTFYHEPRVCYKSDQGRAFVSDISKLQFSACTVLPAKSDSDIMFCLQHYWGLIIDRSHVYSSYP